MRGVRRTLLTAAAALLSLAPAAAAAPTGPLGQSGRWITDARGRVVILHGVNMVYKQRPYTPSSTGFGADDAAFLAREGLNTVRLGVIYAAVEPQPGVYDDNYLASIAQTVDTLASQGIFVLLDFHQDMYNERFQGEGFPDWSVQDDGLPAQPQAGFPGNYLAMPALNQAFQHFWDNAPGPGGVGLQDRYAAASQHVAARFKSEANLLGYDLFNEPWPGPQWPTCANTQGCPAFDQQQLTVMSRRVTQAIHSVDPGHVAWYEPNVLFDFGADTSHGDTGPNAGMSFHDYCLSASNTPSPLAFAQGAGCAVAEELPFQHADAQAQRTGDALLLSEFGATDDLADIQRIVDASERHMVGWQYWHYCQCNDPTTSGAGPTQALVIDPSKPPSGSNLKEDKLKVLARPHPQAVAGTPSGYHFDAAARSFSLDYSTARVGGGGFAPRSDTQVFVPVRQYPQGYDVRVEGAEPVSSPNEQLLRLRTCPGRREVRVRLAPGAGALAADCRAPGAEGARRRRLAIWLRVAPGRAAAGKLTRFRFRATVRGRAVRGALVRFAGRRARTDRRGRAVMRVRLRRTGRYLARATRTGFRAGAASVRVRRAIRRRPVFTG